jgi:3-hydroxyisobutyrate dehydrogenase
MKGNIGWIGTGLMGSHMCNHLINAGYKAFVYNRSSDKAYRLEPLGATVCKSPAEVAAKSDVVFSIVGYPEDVEETYFGEKGIFSNAHKDTICVDMTTSRPTLAQRIYKEGLKKSVYCLDAPVSGGPYGAREAALSIMVGGDLKIYERVLPLFKVMGKCIEHMGEAGAGQHTKMCNQILIASTMIGVVESLLYAYKARLAPNKVIEILSSGAASSWSLQHLGKSIINKDYAPGFYVKHFIKDMAIALNECNRMNLSLPGLALAKQFYVAAVAQGMEDLGTQALFKTMAHLNNIVV